MCVACLLQEGMPTCVIRSILTLATKIVKHHPTTSQSVMSAQSKLPSTSVSGFRRGGRMMAIGIQNRKVHIASTLTSCLFVAVFLIQRHFLKYYRRVVGDYYTTDDAAVGPAFWHDFQRISKLALPSIWSKEGLGSIVFILLFALKAMLRVAQSAIDGRVLTTMVAPRGHRMATAFGSLRVALAAKASAALAMAVVSGCIEHLRHWLITAYRGRLTRHFHDRFYESLVYYHGTALDSRLEAADTVITNYCGEFAEHFAELPYYFLLPFLEASTSLAAVIQSTGNATAGLMMGVVLVTLGALRSVAPPFGRIHAAVLQREDEFRKMHTNAIINVEAVAMHGAGTFTKNRLNAQFDDLKTSLDEASLAKGHFEMLEGTITAIWSAAAYAISSLSAAVADPRAAASGKTERMSAAVVQLRLINDFNLSVKDFIVNIREVSHLSEFTTKLAAFEESLDRVAQGTFCNETSPGFCAGGGGTSNHLPIMSPSASSSHSHDLTPVLCTPETRGSYVSVASNSSGQQILISFQNVDVVNPVSTLLVSQLTMDIKLKQDWAIVGPNGSGKTSILRLLARLWPPSSGRLSVDKSVSFCFLPQTPYMLPKSTMVEQVCFPDEPSVDDGPLAKAGEEGSARSITINEVNLIREAMSLATGSSTVEHLGGWASPVVGFQPELAIRDFDWSSLSGGQRQKLALARAFYHAKKAQVAGAHCICVLDESTSMMDHEAEQMVFANLRKNGFHFISVTHREEVLQHHSHILTLSRDPEDWAVTARERKPIS